jgi:hypothetical protein
MIGINMSIDLFQALHHLIFFEKLTLQIENSGNFEEKRYENGISIFEVVKAK